MGLKSPLSLSLHPALPVPGDAARQSGRRNLSATDRVKLLQRKKGILELQAKARMLATLKQGDEAPAVANLPQRDAGRVRDQLAKEAGVSPHTYAALAKVVEHGTEEQACSTLFRMRNGTGTHPEHKRNGSSSMYYNELR